MHWPTNSRRSNELLDILFLFYILIASSANRFSRPNILETQRSISVLIHPDHDAFDGKRGVRVLSTAIVTTTTTIHTKRERSTLIQTQCNQLRL